MKGIFLDHKQWLLAKPINLFGRWNEQDETSILKRPRCDCPHECDVPTTVRVNFQSGMVLESFIPLVTNFPVWWVQQLNETLSKHRHLKGEEDLSGNLFLMEGFTPVGYFGPLMRFTPSVAFIQVLFELFGSFKFFLVRERSEWVLFASCNHEKKKEDRFKSVFPSHTLPPLHAC